MPTQGGRVLLDRRTDVVIGGDGASVAQVLGVGTADDDGVELESPRTQHHAEVFLEPGPGRGSGRRGWSRLRAGTL